MIACNIVILMYIYIYFILLLCATLGDTALKRFPEAKNDIMRVLDEQSFELSDLGWIATSLDTAIRISIKEDSLDKVREHFPDLLADCIYGRGPVRAHLLFSWQDSVDGKTRFGHYNLLSPKSRSMFAVMLPHDAS